MNGLVTCSQVAGTAAQSATSAPVATLTGSARRYRVLVVEDNPVNQLVARGLLEALGCECTMADNGLHAVTALTRPHTFNLVLMDCQMPELDGLEATRRVRAHEADQGRHIPIVALTANAMPGDRESCIDAGMDDFLSKPFQLSELAAVIDTWCTPCDAGDDTPNLPLPEGIRACSG